MKLNFILAQLLMVLLSVACTSRPAAKASGEPFLVYERTACSGACPVFRSAFYRNGLVITKVHENFLNGAGTYKSQLTDEQLSSIYELLRTSEFWEFKNEYESPMKDLPTTFISYSEEDRTKKIKIYGQAPEDLELVKDRLFETIKNVPWEGPSVK